MQQMKVVWSLFFAFLVTFPVFAADLKVGDPAPLFSLKNQDGKIVSLEENKKKWTVLYFFPRAETPGCTKEAQSYRDSIAQLNKLNTAVYGISTDSVFSLKEFQKNHNLNFNLLSDEKGKVSELYGAKMTMLTISKRFTFVIDDKLKIRSIDQDVDPSTNALKVISEIQKLKSDK